MRKLSVYLLFCFVCLSCKKEIVEEYVVSPAPAAAQIKIDQVLNDSTIVLKWSKYTGENFLKYRLVRVASYVKNGQFGTYAEAVDSSNDINHLSFTESKMPMARDLSYDIYVLKDAPQYPWIQPVARVNYQRPNSLVYGIPTDVLISRERQRLYVTEQNKISVIDYSGRVLMTKDFPVSIGYCSLGDFNGSSELYVPVSDGWLHILDAVTLQLKDRIYVAGYAIGSVVSANEKLYISSSDRGAGGYSNCVKVYDRATKNVIGRTGYWDATRLTLLEGTSVELIDLTINLMPIDLSYYQFSSAGLPLAKKQDSYHGDYSMDASIVRSFPDGSRFITSSSGTIFNKSLVFDRYIKQYGTYSDFAFNSDGSLIYAANATQKKIDVVTYPATTTVNSYTTAFNPYKLFRDGNTLICVGKTYLNQQMTYVLVEKVNL